MLIPLVSSLHRNRQTELVGGWRDLVRLRGIIQFVESIASAGTPASCLDDDVGGLFVCGLQKVVGLDES